VPREGLVGAHTERREGLSSGTEEPVGAGADVAPTRKAELFQRARHELERGRGATSREELDRAATDAAQMIAARRLTAEGTPAWWRDRAALWLRRHWQVPTAALGAVGAAGLIVYLARRA
jgi:hypothetical protein